MIKGAIFDLDGTLLDSMHLWDTIGEVYLRSLGKTPREDLKKTFKTFTLEQSAQYYRVHYGVTLSVDEIVAGVNKIAETFYREHARLKPGAEDFLRNLKARGVKLCIATVTDRDLVEAALNRLGVSGYFSEIFTCAAVGHGKEEPHIYREARRHLNTAKKETVVFEDALHALKTAKADGFLTAGVFDPHEEHRQELKQTADSYIEDYSAFDRFWREIHSVKTAMTIAGSDASGGAGIQADLKTMTMNGVYAMSAITALTAQNTTGVSAIEESTPSFLRQQLDAVFGDIFPDAVKIGMVPSVGLVRVIAERLRYYRAKNIVVDPVMCATSGSSLMKTETVQTFARELLPLADLVTPNIPEAQALSGISVKGAEDMQAAAKIIGDTYGCAVLLKGGHSMGDANDLLYQNGVYRWFEAARIDNPNTHGTGCTLSSAIASYLAKGDCLESAIEKAKRYISGALAAMLDLGSGAGPLNHGFCLNHP